VTVPHTREGRPRRVRRAVVLLPNGFTLANLFCGIYAIVQASRDNYDLAALFVTLGGLADALDGRVARATGSGSRFGEELDSLVDAISFGLAPAMIMFFAVLNQDNWNWLLVFFFTACAVMRLARFNVEQAGRVKTHFHGLPSPAAGMTLASYWWFQDSPMYKQTVILFTNNTTLADLPWRHAIIPVLMLSLGVLMLSDVPYAAWPTIGLRTWRQRIGTVVLLAVIVAIIWGPREQLIFPGLVVYIVAGLLQWVIVGLVQRRGSPEAIYGEDELNGHDVTDELPGRPVLSERSRPPLVAELNAHDELKTVRKRRHRRRPPGGQAGGMPGGMPGGTPGGSGGGPGPRPGNPDSPRNPV
jgi:CDP-diacylglycerol---serine O-phosphatidyltransferase